MNYILLVVGIILIIYGLIGIIKKENDTFELTSEQKEPLVQFDNILSSDIILKRLDIIEDKIDDLVQILDKLGDANEDTIIKKVDEPCDIEKDKFSKVYEKISNIKMDVVNKTVNELDECSINETILSMKNNGIPIEEISNKLGITKGEVLLRIGIKKQS